MKMGVYERGRRNRLGRLISEPAPFRRSMRASASVEDQEDSAKDEECDDDDEECPVPQDYYELLNVAREASPKEIKSAYRKIAKSCHPDVAGEEANDVCILVNDAYETLIDETKRTEYDNAIQAFVQNL